MRLRPRPSLWLAGAVGLFLVYFAFPAGALDPNRMASQYVHDRWGSERGFTGGSVSAIAQTLDGYLWIGTEKCLFRFDGLTFRPIQQTNPGNLPIGPIQALMTDAQGNLWIVLQSTKILRYHDGKFEPGRDEAEAGITSVGKEPDGTVLFASLALGTLAYRSGKFEILFGPGVRTNYTTPASPAINDELTTRRSWATGVTSHRLAEPNSAVLAMAETSDGKIWLGTRAKGLFYLKDGRIFGVSKPSDDKKINCLLAMAKEELWVGTDAGMVRWNGSELTGEDIPAALAHVQILSLARDRDSNIWIGTSRGLLRYNPEGVSSTDILGQASPVNAIFEDREGNLWIGSTRGIERFRDSPFVTFSAPKELPAESSGPIYIDAQQRKWFAPLDGGLYWLKGGHSEAVHNDGLDKDVVYSITGSAEELWVGRQNGGLTQLRFNGNAITSKTYRHSDGLAQDNVYAVYQGDDGVVWTGTLNAGVSKFEKGTFRSYTTSDGLVSNTITSIAQGLNSTLWFGTPAGLSSVSHGQWKTYAVQNGLPSAEVNCLFEDSSHILWIGTASGLAFFDSGQIQVPSNLPDSLREQIFGIAQDRNGWLWMATYHHVLRVRRDKLLHGQLIADDVREFGIDDGLNGVEGVKRQRSVVSDALGRIWFSMNRGLSVVDPSRLTTSSVPVLVKVEGVSADGNAVDLAAPLRIPSTRHRLTFTYCGLSLSVPERVRYRYRLDGFDRGWSDPVAARDAVYTNLSPGSYQFHVIASNSDGVWNENGPTLAVTIVPEFYQTMWFYLLAAVFTGGLVWIAYRWHVRQVTGRLDLQYKERLSERTRIARELHDTLLQSFQGLMLHFQSARNLLPSNPAQASQRLDSALQGAEKAIVEGRNAILDIRSTVLVNDDLSQAITALGEELSANDKSANPPVLNVLEEGAAKSLNPVVRDEIYRILREALRNAFAHARARNIEAEIAYDEKLLRVRIRDDGVGIDLQVMNHGERAGHWGLPGMRERAEQIGGQLDLWSEVGAGTEVELNIPAAVAYKPSSSQIAVHAAAQTVRKESN
ncbi:MAG: two-component regulator propeller domain-containing protein [Candidatus Acidiferrales bacterium]